MVTWPVTLPQDVLLEGYGEQPPDEIIRTPMETGPAKVRRRSTAGPRPVSATIDLTRDQVETLDDFYRNTLGGGALSFDWVHARTQAAAKFRFLSQPVYRPESQTSWLATLNLEILP